jgi:hypothetical protein
MHGKVFKCEQTQQAVTRYVALAPLFFLLNFCHFGPIRLAVFASFGGLLMKLEGDPRNLHEIVPDERIYLMIRKSV